MDSLTILHTEPEFLVVNKPGGLLAVPGRGPDKQDCVVNRILKQFPDCIRQPAVHRLDMYTSGIMLLARTRESHAILSKQFEKRLVKKEYIALLDGIVKGTEGTIDLKFRLDPDNRPHQIYDPVNGKQGISHWCKISDEQGRSRIRFFPLTGRTHQLRLHASHPLGLGVPIIGDTLYGNGCEGDKMYLHATMLSFFHPVSKVQLHFHSPPDF